MESFREYLISTGWALLDAQVWHTPIRAMNGHRSIEYVLRPFRSSACHTNTDITGSSALANRVLEQYLALASTPRGKEG